MGRSPSCSPSDLAISEQGPQGGPSDSIMATRSWTASVKPSRGPPSWMAFTGMRLWPQGFLAERWKRSTLALRVRWRRLVWFANATEERALMRT
jgi:hypothetical protein